MNCFYAYVCVCVCVWSLNQLCMSLCDLVTLARQAPLSMELSRQKYWSGLPFPTPGNFPTQEMEPVSSALTGGFFTTEPPGKPD